MKHGSIFLAGLLGLGSASAALAEEPSWVQADKARGAWQGAQFVYGSGEGAAISRQVSTAEQKSAIRRRKTRPSCYMPGGVA